jgi:peptidoglycan hydrolase CwlO-like protein
MKNKNMLVIIVLLIFGAWGYQRYQDLGQQLREAQDANAQLETQLTETHDKIEQAQSDLDDLKNQIDDVDNDAAADELQRKADDIDSNLNDAEEEAQ